MHCIDVCVILQDFRRGNLTGIPDTVRVGRNVTLNINVTANPPASEIRLSRSLDGPFFSSSNSSLNEPLGTVTVNDTNHVQYKFTADSSWHGKVTASVLTPFHKYYSSVNINVLLGELCYMHFGV